MTLLFIDSYWHVFEELTLYRFLNQCDIRMSGLVHVEKKNRLIWSGDHVYLNEFSKNNNRNIIVVLLSLFFLELYLECQNPVAIATGCTRCSVNALKWWSYQKCCIIVFWEDNSGWLVSLKITLDHIYPVCSWRIYYTVQPGIIALFNIYKLCASESWKMCAVLCQVHILQAKAKTCFRNNAAYIFLMWIESINAWMFHAVCTYKLVIL